MNRVEYRIEQVPLDENGPCALQLVERLAELGRQGWHVAGMDLAAHPSYEARPVTVLLERELDGRVAGGGGPGWSEAEVGEVRDGRSPRAMSRADGVEESPREA